MTWLNFTFIFAIILQATLEMKGEKELKALLDVLALDSSVYARIQVTLLEHCFLLCTAKVINLFKDRTPSQGSNRLVNFFENIC